MTTAVVIGDSFAVRGNPTFWATMGTRLGWTVTANAYESTGYVADGVPPDMHYGDAGRVAAVVAAHPDVVLITGGLNDAGNGLQALVQAACAGLIASLHAGLPAARIIVVAPFARYANGWAPLAAVAVAVRAAASAAGVELIDPMGVNWPAGSPWITGTGDAGTPNGSGNSDVYTEGGGGDHPTQAGYNYLGYRLSLAVEILDGLRPIFASFATEAGEPISVQP